MTAGQLGMTGGIMIAVPELAKEGLDVPAASTERVVSAGLALMGERVRDYRHRAGPRRVV